MAPLVVKPGGQGTHARCFLRPGEKVSTGQIVAVGLPDASTSYLRPGTLTAVGYTG